MKFHKYHGLGNDYIVMTPAESAQQFTREQIIRICDRNFGVGSDGILFGPLPTHDGVFGLKIYNPDGSEAEKSGNGLRIFSRYLYDVGLVKDAPFEVDTPGGRVQAQVHGQGASVTVEMGKVSFEADVIPVTGQVGPVLNATLEVDGQTVTFNAATVGNPHCVVVRDEVTRQEACTLGPKLENHPIFPNRTNVQFLKVLDRNNIQIEIWERGAGYTLASGSSSSAAASVAHRLGLCDGEITVHMPGGVLKISIAPDYSITMTGPVQRVADGQIVDEMFA